MEVKNTAVIGAGTMGASITVALINSGFSVLLKDVSEDVVQSGLRRIDEMLQSQVKRGLDGAEAEKRRALVTPIADYEHLREVDLVIEAALEDIEVKKAVFEQLDAACLPETILSSNTSSLSLTRIGSFTRRPEKVVGLHFFNPAHRMKLVEVIAGLNTSQQTIETALSFGRSLGKLSVRVEECASFLVNRLLGRYAGESLWTLQEGIDAEEIDKAAVDLVMPIGPITLRDMNGCDVGLSVARYNYVEYGERFRPAPILERVVAAGLLGQKTGAGFYLYGEGRKRLGANPVVEKLLHEPPSLLGQPGLPFRPERLFLPMINEAFLALQERICSPEELDPALMAGLGMRKGPLALASQIGLADCLRLSDEHFAIYGERFRPAPLLKRYVWAGRLTAP